MKLEKLIYRLFFVFLFCNSAAYSYSSVGIETDTLRLNPIPKKTKTFPLQPIIIKTCPTAFIWGSIVLTAEYRLIVEMPSSKNQAMQFGVSFIGKSPIWSIIEQQTKTGFHPLDFVFTGIGVQLANKFYLVRKKYGSPFGFYFAPQVCYSNAHISISKGRAYRKTYIDATQFSINALTGLQIGRGKKLTADIYAGLGYKKNIWTYHATTYRTGPFDTSEFGKIFNSNIKVSFGINLGWTIY